MSTLSPSRASGAGGSAGVGAAGRIDTGDGGKSEEAERSPATGRSGVSGDGAIARPGRIKCCLSIQSHVVFGYVGNKASTFPLQLHGFDVCPLNSVQLSNHTGYGSWKGHVMDGDHVTDIMAGLKGNGLLSSFSHVLTGYMRSPSFVRAAASAVQGIRKVVPGLRYVCDPVLGDNGKLYVPEELVGIYRDEVVPLATVLTPNQFECESLTGVKITGLGKAWAACDMLHTAGVETVVITSSDLGATGESLLCISTSAARVRDSRLFGSAAPAPTRARATITVPLLDAYFTGTGDMMAALILAWTERLPGDYISAVEHALASVQAVCHATMAAGSKELLVVQSRSWIEDPEADGGIIKLRAVRADVDGAWPYEHRSSKRS